MRIPFAVPPAGTRPFDVVGIGLNSVDLVAVVSEYPIRNSKHRLERFARLPGGEIATAVAVCARLGWRGRYIGNFGDDDLGALSRESLASLGIDLTASRTVPGTPNRFAVILVDARSGERTILWDRDARLVLQPGDVAADVVTSGRVLMVDGNDPAAAAEAAGFARAAGIPTIVDVEDVRPETPDLLRQTDAIIAAASLPSALTGHADLGDALATMQEEFRAPFVAVTLGAEGCLARCGGREVRTPAFKVTCVDSTGAGDAFRAGFAAGCLRQPEGSIEDVLTYANAVAALNCRELGARGGMPTAAEVDRLFYGQFRRVAEPSDSPIHDLLTRLERERQDADRRYNDALTAVNQALHPLPELPAVPPPLDLRLVNQAAPQAALLEQTRHALGALMAEVKSEAEARFRFESLLVQCLMTVTAFVDTKDRALGGSELRDRLAIVEERLMAVKRELDRRASSTAAPPAAAAEVFAANLDASTYIGFEDRFRGAREEISKRVDDYVPLLSQANDVVDVGCGRGELLDLLRAHGVRARGVDVNEAMAAQCRARGLDVEHGDALSFLERQADGSIGGLIAVQVVEHFKPGYLVRVLEAAYQKMRAGAPLLLETLNPACWMAFFETYIRDVTHEKPLHPETLRYLVEASGFTQVDVQYRQPVREADRLDRVSDTEAAADSAVARLTSALNSHADKLNARLFSSMDYVVIARR